MVLALEHVDSHAQIELAARRAGLLLFSYDHCTTSNEGSEAVTRS